MGTLIPKILTYFLPCVSESVDHEIKRQFGRCPTCNIPTLVTPPSYVSSDEAS